MNSSSVLGWVVVLDVGGVYASIWLPDWLPLVIEPQTAVHSGPTGTARI